MHTCDFQAAAVGRYFITTAAWKEGREEGASAEFRMIGLDGLEIAVCDSVEKGSILLRRISKVV